MPLWMFGLLILVVGMFSFCTFSWLVADDFLDEGLGFGFCVSGAILVIVGFAIGIWGSIRLDRANSKFKEEMFSEENYKETILYDDVKYVDGLRQEIKYLKNGESIIMKFDKKASDFASEDGIQIYVYDGKIGVK